MGIILAVVSADALLIRMVLLPNLARCPGGVVLGRRQLLARRADQVDAVTGWAIPFGLVAGQLYDVLTDPELY